VCQLLLTSGPISYRYFSDEESLYSVGTSAIFLGPGDILLGQVLKAGSDSQRVYLVWAVYNWVWF